MEITITRKTRESSVSVTINRDQRDPNLKKRIRTSLQFFNHMLETMAWRSCMNMRVDSALCDYKLTHVICEDVGLTMGEAFCRLFDRCVESGINGDGAATAGIDEALTRVYVSFEERALLCRSGDAITGKAERVEDMLAADLFSFFEGFVQGAGATLHIDVLKGVDPHHIWESVFRAFGEALRKVFSENQWRKGITPGVKGNVQIEEKWVD